MSRRTGVLANLRSKVKRKKGGKAALNYMFVLLKDPCVYCGELGCDSLDHIHPKFKREGLTTGFGIHHWSNLAPCHNKCNSEKGIGSIFSRLLRK